MDFQDLREILQDREKFTGLAESFICVSVDEIAEEDSRYSKIFELGLRHLVKHAVEISFGYTESPIEKIFINSLLLTFIKEAPLDLIVLPPADNISKAVSNFRATYVQCEKFISQYKERIGNLAQFSGFLQSLVDEGEVQEEDRKNLMRHFALYELLNLENSFHLVLQPGMPDIQVDNKTIRPDMFFWIPADEETKIVVECDGFAFHSSKNAFINDRKRDRALQLKGYRVLRYSGSEIHENPVAVGYDLAYYLLSVARPA